MNNRLVIRGLRYPGDIAIENGVIADIGLIEPPFVSMDDTWASSWLQPV